MVRQESFELIDGFHRVAAMQELGFDSVECIITPCDDETFWDLRIMSASLHKSVAFARAVDWVEECFRVSPWASRYKSAYTLFAASRQNKSDEAKSWIAEKSQKWGLAPQTVEGWLYTKESLAPEVLRDAIHPPSTGDAVSPTHLRRIADELPNRPELQKQVLNKAQTEGLSTSQTEAVARAVRRAPDTEIAQNILSQPVSRTSDDLTRAARIEKLMAEPKREPSPREKGRESAGRTAGVFLGLEQQIHEIGSLSDFDIDNLPESYRQDQATMLDTLVEKIQELQDKLRTTGEVNARIIEGQLVSER